MRDDAIGFLWEDVPLEGKRQVIRVQPDIPDTGWTAPTELPNLDAAKVISVDTETYDPELTDHGPGWGRGPDKGHIVGISVAVTERDQWYFPIRHTVEKDTNLDPEQVLRWAKYYLEKPTPKIGAKILYDAGWLRNEGIRLGGMWYDVQNAEALLNSETPSVSLDSLGEQYLNEGKVGSQLYQWCSDFYGGQPNEKQRKNIWRAPPRLVGPYAEADASLPLRVMNLQWPKLSELGMDKLFYMESQLTKVLLEMRWKGVRVDVGRAERLRDELQVRIDEYDEQLKRLVGFEVNVAASASLAKAFDHFNYPYENTAKGNPSFKAAFLETHGSELAELILARRQAEKLRGTFIESYILGNQINGRVHGQFHQLKGDGYGARSGRLASSLPNLQNIPTRTAEGKLIRQAFTCTVGGLWRKYDYSQIEYRLLAHHAIGPGAAHIRDMYRDVPDTDYHEATQQLIFDITNLRLERGSTKTINFGLIYGMSQPELARRLHLDGSGAKNLFDSYHQAVPFAKATMDDCRQLAEKNGFITTVYGRRSQFPLWGPRKYSGERQTPLPYHQAKQRYGRDIIRAFGHKALNRRLQGGAADLMKKAMVDAYEAGLFDEIGFPVLTVHDELDFDDEDPEANEQGFTELKHIMETCLPLSVPVIADYEKGPNWGNVK